MNDDFHKEGSEDEAYDIAFSRLNVPEESEPAPAWESSQEELTAPSEDETEATEVAEETADDDQQDRAISSDLIRGHINTIILRSLYDGDKYGYEIIAEIEEKSHGQYSLKQPSLYSALKRLEREGYVTSYWGGSVSGGRRKYFSLTDEGKLSSERNQAEWEYSRTVIDSLISDKDFNFNNPAPTPVDMSVLRRSTTRVHNRDEEDEAERTALDEDLRAREEALRTAEEENLKREEALKVQEEIFRYEKEEHARAADDLELREQILRNAQNEQTQREEQLRLREEELRRAEDERLRNENVLEERHRTEQSRLMEELRRSTAEREIQLQEMMSDRDAALSEARRERSRAEALLTESERQNEKISEMELLLRQHTQNEQRLLDEVKEIETRHREELVEQERRIREEDNAFFRERERQIVHQNYLNLVNRTGVTKEEVKPKEPTPTYYDPSVTAPREETTGDLGYRSVINRLYSGTVRQEERTYESILNTERPTLVTTEEPVPARVPSEARSLGGIDFYDIEALALQDGIRITTAGGAKQEEAPSKQLVNKGKALFFSALVVFLLCLAEGSLALGLQGILALPRFFPYLIWGSGLALLFITGLAYMNRYGENSIRRAGNILINAVVAYAVCVIVILIIALAVQIDFSNAEQLATYVIFPVMYFFGVIAFGIAYYAQTRPFKE